MCFSLLMTPTAAPSKATKDCIHAKNTLSITSSLTVPLAIDKPYELKHGLKCIILEKQIVCKNFKLIDIREKFHSPLPWPPSPQLNAS